MKICSGGVVWTQKLISLATLSEAMRKLLDFVASSAAQQHLKEQALEEIWFSFFFFLIILLPQV